MAYSSQAPKLARAQDEGPDNVDRPVVLGFIGFNSAKFGPVFDTVTKPKWACRTQVRRTITKACAGLATALACHPAWGIELYSGGNMELRWDNTIRYSTSFRLDERNPALVSRANFDDGNRNFDPGLISSRFDLFSQLDFSKEWFGFHVSAAAWYDSVYNQRNDNDSPGTFNPASVPHDKFPRGVRGLHGHQAEMVDAFVYANTELGGLPFSFRLGRHTLLWGESLFFPNNGIAAGQAPVDAIKLLNQSTIYARDVFMPVAQVSGSLQFPGALALEAYYQFEWRKTRLPGAGSYFSVADFLDTGGERFFLGANQYLSRTQDQRPPASGQFGAALRWSSGQTDYGLYAVRYDAKDPQVYYRSGVVQGSRPPTVIDASIVDLAIGKVGNYNLVYPRGIEIYGASASGYLGGSNIAVEISGRRNMPLVSTPLFLPPGRSADGHHNALYAVGDTLHAQISAVTTLARSAIWDSANVNAEVAGVQRLRVTKNPGALNPANSKFAAAFRATFEPTYFEVMPNIDVTMRLDAGYNFIGKSSTDFYQNRDAGDLDVGVTATYRVVWVGSLTFTHFLGNADRQVLADRNFIRLSIERTF